MDCRWDIGNDYVRKAGSTKTHYRPHSATYDIMNEAFVMIPKRLCVLLSLHQVIQPQMRGQQPLDVFLHIY